MIMLATCRYGILLLFLLMVGSVAAENSSHTEKQNLLPTISETATLRAKEGYIDGQLGAEVKEVTIDQENEGRLVEVHIPVDPEKVDEIEVVPESGQPLKGDRIEQVIKDYENDNVGIKFYLPKQKNWVFKIKLTDQNDAGDKL